MSQLPRLHQNVIWCFAKERKMGVLQTPILCLLISMSGILQKRQVHSCSDVYLQQGYATT